MLTIGRPGAVPVVVPHALYKIVIREGSDGTPEALGFIFEQEPKTAEGRAVPGLSWTKCSQRQFVYDHTANLRPVREIEQHTGLRFFAALPAAQRDALAEAAPQALWTVETRFWDAKATCAGQVWHPASAGPTP